MAIKENLKTYLNQYKMISDGLNIVDGYIINFSIEFDISILKGYNRREVLTNCNLHYKITSILIIGHLTIRLI